MQKRNVIASVIFADENENENEKDQHFFITKTRTRTKNVLKNEKWIKTKKIRPTGELNKN